jgi:hypothetical protein
MVFVIYGLLATGKVNNRETPHSQADRPLDVKAILIRPAMFDALAHAPEQGLIDLGTTTVNNSDDSTHTE